MFNGLRYGFMERSAATKQSSDRAGLSWSLNQNQAKSLDCFAALAMTSFAALAITGFAALAKTGFMVRVQLHRKQALQ